LGNIILDVEPLAVMVFGLDTPLHGYLHTFLLATVVGLLLGFVMFSLEKPMQPLYRKIQLETNRSLKIPSFLLAGVFGTALHVVFDALLYSEMAPFFPLTINPLLNLHTSMPEVYSVCVWLGIFGIAYYGALIAYSLYKKSTAKDKLAS
jgi:membrane-bound metal-dependent hydrolase YbcI (DUF457 family)